jgi:hypothetical protein
MTNNSGEETVVFTGAASGSKGALGSGQIVDASDAEPTPAFWATVELPDSPPPPAEDQPEPFMRGSGRRWDREPVRGLGHPSRAGEPHGLAPLIEEFVRDADPKGDAA